MDKERFYCMECGAEVDDYDVDYCDECKVYCTHCGCSCTGESIDGMCEDCYEDYKDDCIEDQDED